MKTNELLTLMIKLIIDTHNYVDLNKHKDKLKEIMKDV